MLVCQGHWNELADQCKRCSFIRAMSLHMDGNHYYACGKYPLKDSNEICPWFNEANYVYENDEDEERKRTQQIIMR